MRVRVALDLMCAGQKPLLVTIGGSRAMRTARSTCSVWGMSELRGTLSRGRRSATSAASLIGAVFTSVMADVRRGGDGAIVRATLTLSASSHMTSWVIAFVSELMSACRETFM